MPVLSGVPQGGILGPLLFVIFVNDVFTVVWYCTLLLFADDANLFKQTTFYEDSMLIQHNLNALYTWSDENYLTYGIKLIDYELNHVHIARRCPLWQAVFVK